MAILQGMRGKVLRYSAAVGAVVLATATVVPLHGALDGGAYLVFVAAVAAVAGAVGFGPALVTTVGAVAAIDYFFLSPVHSFMLFAMTDAALLGLFGGVALLVTWFTALSQRRLERAEREALKAAGLANLMLRHAAELEQDVNAMHALRGMRKSP